MELSLSSFQLRGKWHALGIIRDISDRKLAEEERLQKEKLQSILEMTGAVCHNFNRADVSFACATRWPDRYPEPVPLLLWMRYAAARL